MTPHKLPLNAFTEGDCFEGIPALNILINGAAPASALETVTMAFQKVSRNTTTDVVVLSSEVVGEITIVDAAAWEISIPEQIVPGLTFGKWAWRMKFTAADGCTRTYLADEITVLETIPIPVPAP